MKKRWKLPIILSTFIFTACSCMSAAALVHGASLFSAISEDIAAHSQNADAAEPAAEIVNTDFSNEAAPEFRTAASTFINVGNDPNNIYQSMYNMAFDAEHMYFMYDDRLMQAKYDGTEAKVIGSGRLAFLNIWGGNLYYISHRDNVMTLKKIDLTTFETSDIFSTGIAGETTSMLIVDGIAVIGYNSGCARIEAVDLETGSSKLMEATGSCYDPRLSVSEDSVYAFVEDSENEIVTWCIPRNELKTGTMYVAADAQRFGAYKYRTVLFTPTGIDRLSADGMSSGQDRYQKYLYSDITENRSWASSEDISSDSSTWNEEVRNTVRNESIHYEIGDNLVALINNKIYFYPGFDFSKQIEIAECDIEHPSFSYDDGEYSGVFADTVYTIRNGSSISDARILAVHTDGTVTEHPIVLSAEQPVDSVGLIVSSSSEDVFTWKVYTNGATLSGYSGTEASTVTVPDTYSGVPVRAIGDKVFEAHEEITSVVLPETLTSIGKEAFLNCTALTSVHIPDTVTDIGRYAFSGCTSLEAFNIPTSLTDILSGTFSDTAVKTLDIPANVVTIGAEAFHNCRQLTQITFHEGLAAIGDESFSYCPGLTELEIPHSVNYVEGFSFWRCDNVTVVYGGDAAQKVAKYIGVPYTAK